MIVEAVGTSSGTIKLDKSLSKRIEEAMTKAVEQALSEGVSDPEVIKARILVAREEAKKQG
jgi:hypothetical protein